MRVTDEDSCDLGAQLRARLSAPAEVLVTVRISNAGCFPTRGSFAVNVNNAEVWHGRDANSGTSVHCGWTYKKSLFVNPFTGAVRTDGEELVCHWPHEPCW